MSTPDWRWWGKCTYFVKETWRRALRLAPAGVQGQMNTAWVTQINPALIAPVTVNTPLIPKACETWLRHTCSQRMESFKRLLMLSRLLWWWQVTKWNTPLPWVNTWISSGSTQSFKLRICSTFHSEFMEITHLQVEPVWVMKCRSASELVMQCPRMTYTVGRWMFRNFKGTFFIYFFFTVFQRSQDTSYYPQIWGYIFFSPQSQVIIHVELLPKTQSGATTSSTHEAAVCICTYYTLGNLQLFRLSNLTAYINV